MDVSGLEAFEIMAVADIGDRFCAIFASLSEMQNGGGGVFGCILGNGGNKGLMNLSLKLLGMTANAGNVL